MRDDNYYKCCVCGKRIYIPHYSSYVYKIHSKMYHREVVMCGWNCYLKHEKMCEEKRLERLERERQKRKEKKDAEIIL